MGENHTANTGKMRFPEYDIAKGIGVLLVVIGHVQELPFPFLVWIFSFHIPLYFFLSGLFVKKETTEPFLSSLKKNVTGLLVPYCVFSAVFILVDVLFRDPLSSPRLEVKLFLTGQGGYAILWFFFALFFVRLLLDIGKRLIKNRIVLSLTFLGFVIAGFLLHRLFFFNSFKIATILYSSGFYYLGFLMSDWKPFHTVTSVEKWYLCPVFLGLNILGTYALVRLFGTTLDLNSATSYDILLNYATALCGIFFTIILSRLMTKTPLLAPFSYLGKHSLIFYPLLGYIPFKLEHLAGTDLMPLQQAIPLRILFYAIAFGVSAAVVEVKKRWKKGTHTKTA